MNQKLPNLKNREGKKKTQKERREKTGQKKKKKRKEQNNPDFVNDFNLQINKFKENHKQAYHK